MTNRRCVKYEKLINLVQSSNNLVDLQHHIQGAWDDIIQITVILLMSRGFLNVLGTKVSSLLNNFE